MKTMFCPTIATAVVLTGMAIGGASAADRPLLAVPVSPDDDRVVHLDPAKELSSLAAEIGLPDIEWMFGGAASVSVVQEEVGCGGTVEIVINLSGAPVPVAGGQFFLEYDTSVLDFVSADPGDAPFGTEIFESVDEVAGTIDYAVGIAPGGVGSAADATMATLTFATLSDVCFGSGTYVGFRANVPSTTLTDEVGQPISTSLSDLTFLVADSTPPTITAPADITVKADVGGCTATLDFDEPFDDAVVTCADLPCSEWLEDRYPPAIFEQSVFMGENVLRHGVDVDDSEANRPPQFDSIFYNWQGYKRSVSIPQGMRLSADVWIPADWNGVARVASLWGQLADASGVGSGFPVLAFNGSVVDAVPAGSPQFRAFVQDTDQDFSNGFQPGWINMGAVTGFDRWYRFEIELTAAGTFEFIVTDLSTDTEVAALSDAGTFDSVVFTETFLQLYNFGDTYETVWDNVALGPDGPAVSDCIAAVSYERSDDPALALDDPFPSGSTTVTWTVTDACGLTASADQLIEVLPVNELSVDLELTSGIPAGTTYERCITFELVIAGCGTVTTEERVVLFTADGIGSALASVEFDVPCGDYACITARDRLHTLASTDGVFGIVGDGYAAAFTGGTRLIGGNLNDDAFIDILDFGVFVSQFGVTYPSVDTDCTTPAPHADIDGSGTVDAQDFGFISINFLAMTDASCCPAPDFAGGERGVGETSRRGRPWAETGATPAGPVRRISVTELGHRGLGDLRTADLNRDGWLDEADLVLFLGGARP